MVDHDEDAPDVDYEADELPPDEAEDLDDVEASVAAAAAAESTVAKAAQEGKDTAAIAEAAAGATGESEAKNGADGKDGSDTGAEVGAGGDGEDEGELKEEGASVTKQKSGAGDSETDDDSDDDEGRGPAPHPNYNERESKANGRGMGDSETESSSSEGEMVDEEGRRHRDRDGGKRSGRTSRDRSDSRERDDRMHSRDGKSHSRSRGLNGKDHKRYADGDSDSDFENDRTSERRPKEVAPSRGYGNVPPVNQSEMPPQMQQEGRRIIPMLEENIGVYIPPAKRRMLEMERKQAAQANQDTAASKTETASKPATPVHLQRQSWENLKRTINGTINRLSPQTIKPLIHSLFQNANLVRGRGILARSLLRAAQASPQYSPAYASLMAVINTKLPECGELLLTRAILAFRRGYKTRDKSVVSSTLALMGHMFNQGMAHELLCLQVLTVLLDGDPTEDSVDVAVGFMCVVGRALGEVSPAGVHAVMERFRGLLHEGTIGRRAQFRIEALLKIKREGFRDYPTIPDEEHLDLVERDDQITFELGLDDEGLKKEEGLDVFRYDSDFDEKEEEWARIRAEILGEDSDDDSGSGSGDDSSSDSESEEEKDIPDQELSEVKDEKKTVVVQDLTETDLVHLRRTIYLTIMSSATFEECTHKLAKMDIPPGRESELINMIIECCSQERTFLRYYGLVSGRFCLLNERWQDAFEEAFAAQYNTIHRLETNKLRNVAKLFGHLLHTDSISWSVLSVIHLNEDETTSSSRIFIKILVQEMAESMGMVVLKERFDTDNPDPDGPIATDDTAITNFERNGRELAKAESSSRDWFRGMFPKDNARNTRYAINFFTSIGLGPLTDGMREFLKNAPKLILAQAQAMAAKEAETKRDDASSVISTSSSSTSSFDSSSSTSSFSSSSSSSYSSSSSNSRYRKKRGGRRGRGKKRGRSSRSYSSSSSSSSSSSESESSRSRSRRRNRKTSSKRQEKHQRSSSRNRSYQRSASNGSASPSDGQREAESPRNKRVEREKNHRTPHDEREAPSGRGKNRRSVSTSPSSEGREGVTSFERKDDHLDTSFPSKAKKSGREPSRSRSLSRENSPRRSNSSGSSSDRGERRRGRGSSRRTRNSPSNDKPFHSGSKGKKHDRNKRRRSNSFSSSFSDSQSRSGSPPVRKERKLRKYSDEEDSRRERDHGRHDKRDRR